LSAQICSLSENCAPLWLDAITGSLHAAAPAAPPAAAACGSSVCDTVIAS
jgi:hypothetical protein